MIQYITLYKIYHAIQGKKTRYIDITHVPL